MDDTLNVRHKEATVGAGCICVSAGLTTMTAHEPFVASTYPYLKKVGRLTEEPWSTIRGISPMDLVPRDPYAPSQHRPGRTSVWDAVIGIPTSRIRPREVLETGRITALRSINQTWLGPMIEGMNRIGPMVPSGESRRPTGPYIVDLLYNPLGWKILEGAHILAHRRQQPVWRRHIERHLPVTAKSLQQCVAELVTCMVYGLPIDVGVRDAGTPAIAQYGLDIAVSSQFRCPTLKVPWSGPLAPVPDLTMGYIAVGLSIEPVPRGVLVDNEDWLECNRWTCLPTQINIAGWEMMDVISHYPIAAQNPKSTTDQKYYVMNPADLMAPDRLGDLIKAAVPHRGEPVFDNVRYFRVEDWLDSDDYQRGLWRTPTFPCASCLCYNPRTDGAPVRPRAMWKNPDDLNRVESVECQEWTAARERIMRIAEKATIFYESSIYGGRSRTLLGRQLRNRGYHAELAYLNKVRTLKKRIDKAHQDGIPSRAVETKRALDTLMVEHQKENEKCFHSELMSVSPELSL